MKSVLATSNPTAGCILPWHIAHTSFVLNMSPSAEEKEDFLSTELSWCEKVGGCHKMGVYSNTRFSMVEKDGTISDTLKKEECGLCRMTRFLGRTYGEDANSKVSDRPP